MSHPWKSVLVNIILTLRTKRVWSLLKSNKDGLMQPPDALTLYGQHGIDQDS